MSMPRSAKMRGVIMNHLIHRSRPVECLFCALTMLRSWHVRPRGRRNRICSCNSERLTCRQRSALSPGESALFADRLMLFSLVRHAVTAPVASDRRNGSSSIDHDFPPCPPTEGSAIGFTIRRRAQHAILPHHVAFVIRQQRKFCVQLFAPVIQSRYEIAADTQNLRVYIFQLANTSLVLSEFTGSTTGEGRREKRQDDGLSFPGSPRV